MRTGPAASLAAVAGTGGLGVLAWPFTVDDAFIVARYADRLVAGHGLTMRDGPPTDGVTEPLWLGPMMVARSLGLDPIAVAKGLGLAAMVLAVLIAVRASRRRALGSRAAWVAALALLVSPQLAAWSVSGLSTGLAALLVTGAVLGGVSRPAARPVTVGGCVAALAWLRPELALFALVLLVGLALRDRRAGFVAGGFAVAGALAVVAYRLALFGDPFPLAFYAKPSDPSHGLGYALSGALVITGIGGAVLAGLAVRRGRVGDRAVGAALLAHLVAVALAGGDWMPGFRLLVPVLPAYAWLAASGFGGLVASRWRGARPLALTLAVLALAAPTLDLVAQLPRLRESGGSRERVVRPLALHLGRTARRVALVDAGYVPWVSGIDVVDLGGVTDPEVARAPGGHLDKIIDPTWLAARAPDAILLHSAIRPEADGEGRLTRLAGFPVEQRLARSDFVREGFRVDRVVELEPSYFYVLLLRRAVTAPRAPSLRAPRP